MYYEGTVQPISLFVNFKNIRQLSGLHHPFYGRRVHYFPIFICWCSAHVTYLSEGRTLLSKERVHERGIIVGSVFLGDIHAESPHVITAIHPPAHSGGEVAHRITIAWKVREKDARGEAKWQRF